MNTAINNISGHGNPNSNQQFYQTTATGVSQVYNFQAFTPVNGDVTFTVLTDRIIGSNVATAYNVSGNYFQNVTYFGEFNNFTMATGEILIHLTAQ